jgi:2-methylisocitrate lyase-like PEP mutase family enzyme
MRHVVRRLVLLATGLAFAANAGAQDLSSAESSEYLIKAGYIYNFAKLVEWPSSAARQGQPIVIGVLGNDAFATALHRVVDGKKIDDRPFLVKRLKNKEYKDCGCQILFIAAAESARADEIIQLQNTASVLTIAEAPDFANRGGIIALTLQDSKVRFIVNVDAATQAALTISSRLLTLATIVHTTR